MLDDKDNWMYCDDSHVVQAAGEIPFWEKRYVPVRIKVYLCLFQKCQSGREFDWGLCDFNFQLGVLPD